MNKRDMNDYIYKPAAVAAVAMGGFSTYVDSKYTLGGMRAPVSLGLIAGGSSLVSSVLADTVYDSLPANESDLLYGSTAPVITGLSTMAGGYWALGGAGGMTGMLQLFATGALSEVVGVYVDEMIIMPAVGIK
jgi:hypothetical protein